MPPFRRRSVLVTGSNRSGTTWVGRMLCLSRELAYVHEPFNPGIWPRWMPERLPFRNLYICSENEGSFLGPVRDVIERRFPWRQQIGDIRSMGGAARLLRDGLRHRVDRFGARATLVKDPIAVFSAEWLADRFDLDVVVMVRGPVAFASSVKRLAWAFDFGQWARQERLMADHLGEFGDAIERAAEEPPDLLDQAILSWNATYAYVERMRRAHSDWHVVDYEDLAASPSSGFRGLYAGLGLRFDDRAAAGVARHSDEGNVKEVPAGDKGGIRRDSRAALDTWRGRLTPDEVARVEEGTREVAERLGRVVGGAS